MNDPLQSIQGFFFDLDGVIYIDDDLIPGAAETIHFLKERQILCRFLTNTTIFSRNRLYEKIVSLHLPIQKEEIISPPAAAVRYLRQQGHPTCHLVIMDATREDFAEFQEDDLHPDYVVIGKIGERWDYPRMNRLFTLLMQGSSLIALHKDRYTMTRDGLKIEFGAFIAGLEYATGKTALVMGKPSASFFHSALEDIALPPDRVVMVGDDLISDIRGAQDVGMRGFLVQTGKYRDAPVSSSPIQPDLILSSIADIPQFLIGMK